MAFWIVETDPAVGGKSTVNGTKVQIVEADDAATARSLASGVQESDSTWSDATALDTSGESAADYTGYSYRVVVAEATAGGTVKADVTHVGIAADDVDDIGAALVILLNATADIANASYAANVLTAAAIADGLGDHKLTVTATPPGAFAPVPELIGAIVDEGIAAAVLTAATPAPTAIPKVIQVITS